MKIRELIMVVKYGQGLVVFDTFLNYLKFLEPSKREIFLAEIIGLIIKMQPQPDDAERSIKESELSEDSAPCILLRQGLRVQKLQEIAHLPEEELESSFKLLLSLFTLVYKREFKRNKNSPDKFWYWDFSVLSNTLKVVDLKKEETVDLSRF